MTSQGEKLSKKAAKPQTRWTEQMDEILVVTLFEECMTGGKRADNGWKPEALRRVVNVMESKLAKIVSTDNVRYRLKTLKKDYLIAKETLNQSGFNYDNDLQCIVADDDVWNDYAKAHPEAAPLRYKMVKFFDKLGVICGNETANGFLATEGFDINTQTTPISINDDFDEEAFVNMTFGHEEVTSLGNEGNTQIPATDVNSSTRVLPPTGASNKRRKNKTSPDEPKRIRAKMSDDDAAVTASFKLLAQSAREIADAFKSPDYSMINITLEAIPELTEEDIIMAMDMFGSNRELAGVFFGLSERMRYGWLRMKLDRRR